MARRTGSHSTRLSQVHEAALDTQFRQGQRVQTIDGLAGRVLWASSSFAPGISEYEVVLDHGMGQGTYTASQLRPVPEDYRGGRGAIPPGLLPAGVVAAQVEAAETHLASDDYPEMGGILHDRPDPGREIQVIGGLRRTAASTYGRPDDPRDEDYNGGEEDLGMYWAGPAQQQWMHENLGPQEEAVPPVPDELAPSLARLAQIEEACQIFGGTFHRATTYRATTINNQQVDEHGDAPEHGTIPRASDPVGYDKRSTEGEGDPVWTKPLMPEHKEKSNGAMVAMYPEGIYGGDGPGIMVGPVVARHVPWTGQERGNLHSWDNGASAQDGDFVPSTRFTGRRPVTEQIEDPAPGLVEEELSELAQQHTSGVRVKVHGPDDFTLHQAPEHDDDANSLNSDQQVKPGAEEDQDSLDHGEPQVGSAVDEDSPQPGKPPGNPGAPLMPPGGPQDAPGGPAALPPTAWPMTQAPILSGGPAYTQGTNDQHGRVFPPPPPAPPPDVDGDESAEPGEDGDSKKVQLEIKSGALSAFVLAASSPPFRFEFTAAWRDVVAKAKRIRKAGRVRITHSSAGMVIGEVGGDHDVYESGIQRPPARPQTIQHWACGCPWASFRQDKQLAGRLNGRPCSHVMALQFEALSRTRRERKVDADLSADELGVPHKVVVKSMPPWGPGGWSQTWLAPAASLHKTAEMFCPSCGDDRDDSGRCYACGLVSRDLRQERPLPGAANIGQECLYAHDGPCPDLHQGQNERTAESAHHPRPAGFHSEIGANPLHDPGGWTPKHWSRSASHVMTGYLDGKIAGRLHLSVSDDGRAHEVHMLHSEAPGKGVASAMMDDLYHHVKSQGGWLDHGERTEEGNNWWSTYREPSPEVSTHHTEPESGWRKYWEPMRVAEDAETNLRNSGGRGAHTPVKYNPMKYPFDDRHEEWTHARGLSEPAQRATAVLLAAGEDLADVIALARLAGFSMRADQTNAPWGSENVSRHPPQKPYGATEPPNPEQSPASYGFLSAPDPDDWGSIQEDNAMQMPLSNQGSRAPHHALSSPEHKVLAPGAPGPLPVDLRYPDVGDFREDQGSFSYTDRANAGGPSTSIEARDPQGIRMEEMHREPGGTLFVGSGEDGESVRSHLGIDGTAGDAQDVPHPFADGGARYCEACGLDHGAEVHHHTAASDPAAEEFRRHLVQMHGKPGDDPLLVHDYSAHMRDHADSELAQEKGLPLWEGHQPHPYEELEHERRYTSGRWPDASSSSGFVADLHSEHEPALPSTTGDEMGDQSVAEGLSGGAQIPSPVTQEPGMGSGDEYLTPDDQSIQTMGTQQWSGDGTDSGETAVTPGSPPGSLDDIVASFQRSAAAGKYSDHGPGNGDIAQAAQAFLKTADALPDEEARELIREGHGTRARNLGLLELGGTHYEGLGDRGDQVEDDLIWA